jgi:putative endonuclease
MTTQKSTKPFGAYGEQLAVNHLQQNHYQIVNRNWRCKQGEIDIIVSKGAMLIFVEVRTRHAPSTEAAFESVSASKQRKLISLAHTYLSENDLQDLMWRIDVIAIAILPSGKAIIEHIEDALDW